MLLLIVYYGRLNSKYNDEELVLRNVSELKQ